MKAKILIDNHDLVIIGKLFLNEEMFCIDLYDCVRLKSYSNFSQHINKLIDLGFVTKTKRGNKRILCLTEKGGYLFEAFGE